jgi:hypothetical protein
MQPKSSELSSIVDPQVSQRRALFVMRDICDFIFYATLPPLDRDMFRDNDECRMSNDEGMTK